MTLREHRAIMAALARQMQRLDLSYKTAAQLIGASLKSLYSWRTGRRSMTLRSSHKVKAATALMGGVILPAGLVSAARRRVLIKQQLRREP